MNEVSYGELISPEKSKYKDGSTLKQKNSNEKILEPTKNQIVGNELVKNEKDKKEQQEQIKQVWFCQLFRFATQFDILLMIVGSIAALGMGVALPSFSYIWGQMTDAFASQNMVEASKSTLLTFLWVGLGVFGAGWIMFACWMIAGQRQAISCRKAYLRSLLRQQIGWFDQLNQTQLASKFAKDTFAFQGAIGEKISTLIMTIGTLISGFVFAFVTGWLMTLVLLASLPALAIAGVLYMKAIGDKDKEEQAAYAKAGGMAEQSLSSIKTVKQLNGQLFQKIRYEKCLAQASSKSFKFLLFSALGIGALFFCMLASYSFGFWYGSKCILNTNDCPYEVSKQNYTAGNVLVVFFSVVMAGFNLSQLTPAFRKISEGRQAAARIFQVIDRKPLIENPQNGYKIPDLKGKIKFQNVTFSYPKDKSRIIFKNLTMQFDLNKTGLVGQSGCGKSTALQLIMRFYDPDEGKVTLDGHDLKTLDLRWLRQQIGYVGQQPVLFATSIRQNLSFGNDKATQNEIIQALKMAQAYQFVQQLQNKLQTYVGFGGGQLSGGQKQRIAIARAILRKPKIMLLDEATSALDRRNQKLIQQTLQKVTRQITTITVAHRVKTIMNSDLIYVLQKGGIAEKGKFKDLKMFKNHHHQIDNQENLSSPTKNKEQKDEQQIQQINLVDNNLAGKKLEDQFKSKEEQQKQENQKLIQKYEKSIFSRLFSYSSGKIPIFLLGIFVSLANGVIFPIFSIFLSKMLTALLTVQINKNDSKQIDNINLYALIFLILAICAFILSTIQIFCFQIVGVQITKKIRLQTYYKIMRMPAKWFDLPKNNAGTLAARLSTDCQVVNSMTTTVVQIMIQNLSTLITGIIIAFIYEWRTSLVALGLLPVMIIAGVVQMSLNTGFSDKTDAAYKDSSSLIMQAMVNIRTVSSFGYEGIIAQKYDEKMQKPYELAIKKGNASGFFFGTSQLVMFIIFGLLFYLGALFVRDNQGVTVTDMFTAVYAIMFAGMTAGNNAHFMPDTAACKNSAANLFQILDSQDQDQMQIANNSKMIKSGLQNGDIELENVSFKYQSRNEYVFQNLNLKIKNGTKAAFVGSSGCGKSTILQLLLRFYDPEPEQQKNLQINLFEKGKIKLNGVDIKDYDIHYLRSFYGVVSQEPVLFNGSFKENIMYNLSQEEATDQKIYKAAQLANALSFIEGSEELANQNEDKKQDDQNDGKGFNRNVGVKGSHISGGQKQRVAIARAILRNPHCLLLDEATSALDSANQKKVQQSINKITQGKTVISVAHRIQTIKNSDQIFVFEKGKIVESGRYNDLVNKKGYFYKLERGTEFT